MAWRNHWAHLSEVPRADSASADKRAVQMHELHLKVPEPGVSPKKRGFGVWGLGFRAKKRTRSCCKLLLGPFSAFTFAVPATLCPSSSFEP